MKNPTSEEVDKPISTALMKVSKATSFLGEIPLLSQFMFPLSWASAQLSKAVSVFGYSAPNIDTPSNRVVRIDNYGMSNFDNPIGAVVLGSSAVNSIQHNPGIFGTDLDEMSLKYIAGIYAYVTTVTWTDTAAIDTELYSVVIEPENLSNSYSLSPLAFITRLFKYQRGGVKIRVKVVKTTMHSGRLMFLYNPGSTVSVPDIRRPFLIREIVDLRESSEIEFVLPYLLLNPWRDSDPTQDFNPMGFFQILVHDKLRRPATASASVELLIEFCAADDFEVCGMTNSTLEMQRGPEYHATEPFPILFKAQSADPEVINGCRAAGGVMGNMELQQEGLSHLTLIPGESINSLKQYLTVMRPWFGCLSTGTGNERVSWWQDSYKRTTNIVGGEFGNDIWDIIHFCFAYRVGATRYFVYDAGNNGRLNQHYVMNSLNERYTSTDLAVVSSNQNNSLPPEGPFVHYNVMSQPIIQASPYPMTSLRIIKLNGALSPAQSPSRLSVTNLVQEAFLLHISRGFSEDARLGYFLSVPPTLA
jgi:hypothetical protein